MLGRIFSSIVILSFAVLIFALFLNHSNYSFDSIKEAIDGGKGIMSSLKDGLYGVKVNKNDATQLEQKLDKFSKWNERFELATTKGVPIEKLKAYLDHHFKAYKSKGLTLEDRQKWDAIFYSNEWNFKIYEWKFNTQDSKSSEDSTGARYGMFAFHKSADGKFVDCAVVIYKLDFEVAPRTIMYERSVLWGLITWTTYSEEQAAKYITKEEINQFQNFFRYKAMVGFQKEGVIDRISYEDDNL